MTVDELCSKLEWDNIIIETNEIVSIIKVHEHLQKTRKEINTNYKLN